MPSLNRSLNFPQTQKFEVVLMQHTFVIVVLIGGFVGLEWLFDDAQKVSFAHML